MLIGRNDVENMMRLDPASACLENSLFEENNVSNAETVDAETEMSDLLLSLRPIKQVFSALFVVGSCVQLVWKQFSILNLHFSNLHLNSFPFCTIMQ